MKKQLLLGSALLAAITAFPQNGRLKPQPKSAVKGFEKIDYVAADPVVSTAPSASNKAIEPQIAAGTATSAATWQKIGGSMNIFGVLVSQQKPLQYNDQLNAVSFIQRKSPTYNAPQANNSGAIIADISTNWGATWDSTCVWADANNWARYPQGGIYNPPGNTNISNAYVVAMGPCTDPVASVGWKGTFYASKQLGTGNYNNTASTAPNAMQYFPNSTATGSVLGHDFSRYSFSSTDDGKVRSLGVLTNGANGAATPGDSALYLMTGSFNGGVFTWSGDKFQPATALQSDGSTNLYGESIMAWNESGTIGYVVGIGALNSATLSNRGWQPIVYKTTNSGASWTMIQGIDFNSPGMSNILNSLASTQSDPNLVIPFFNVSEGFDATVDLNGKLHILSTVVGTYDKANDSLIYTGSFSNWDGESYNYPHGPGYRPYIYDFIGDGSGPWTYVTVDSMSSEGLDGRATTNGFNDDPWDTDANGNKVGYGARLSLTRTPDGQYIVYTWAESDTNFTNSGHKWNALPNLKARAAKIGISNGYTLSPTELNYTKLPAGNTPPNPAINARAFFHYTSRTTAMPLCGATTTINVPTTISNNPNTPLTGSASNIHWYSTAKLDFSGIVCAIGVNENAASAIGGLSLYPNPTENVAIVGVDLKQNGPIAISVYNMVGQLVYSTTSEGTIGNNQLNIDLSALSSGVYMVKVNVNGVNTTAKLIKE